MRCTQAWECQWKDGLLRTSAPAPFFDPGRHSAQHADGLLGVCARGRLARQHQRVCPLPHHIRNVRHLQGKCTTFREQSPSAVHMHD